MEYRLTRLRFAIEYTSGSEPAAVDALAERREIR
jgi:hypothetical protein